MKKTTTTVAPAPLTISFPGEKIDIREGYARHNFKVAGKNAWVVEPAKPLPGKVWTWVTEFPDAFTPRTGVPKLIGQGVYHAHISDFNRLGCDDQLKVMNEFYSVLTKAGLAKKPALIGLSRGGFMAYRWAQKNPGQVACIYGDAPVCDLKSWPGGFGTGKGSKGDWDAAKKLYGWKNDAEGKAFKGNALDEKPLAKLAAAKVPLLHVVGDEDDVVPVAENTAILAERYKKLGGDITVIHHKAGHHPHGLDDPEPVIAFILKHVASCLVSQRKHGKPTRASHRQGGGQRRLRFHEAALFFFAKPAGLTTRRERTASPANEYE
jgi:dienelactone hydrolase